MLSVWEPPCGGNSEIYQGPQGAPNTGRVSFRPGEGICTGMGRGGGIYVLLLTATYMYYAMCASVNVGEVWEVWVGGVGEDVAGRRVNC